MWTELVLTNLVILAALRQIRVIAVKRRWFKAEVSWDR